MKYSRLLLMALLVVVALLPGAVTFAKELVQLTITGPGLDEALEVTDAEQLAGVNFESIMESGRATAPTDLEANYFEVRMGVGDGSEVVATFVYHYYPAINADYGYLYFAEFIGGTADSVGQWFRLNDDVDRQLRHLLRDAGVRFGVSNPNCVAPEATPAA